MAAHGRHELRLKSASTYFTPQDAKHSSLSHPPPLSHPSYSPRLSPDPSANAWLMQEVLGAIAAAQGRALMAPSPPPEAVLERFNGCILRAIASMFAPRREPSAAIGNMASWASCRSDDHVSKVG